MPLWKRNLIVCWFGMFAVGIGMSQIAPILPLYIEYLGVSDPDRIKQLSGLAFGITFIISAIFSPIWGIAADRYGRKLMLLRASLGMSLIVFLTGFAPDVYTLIGFRTLLGVITGYSTACITLIATQTDKKNAGFALGTLSTAGVAGSLLGPLFGGFIGDTAGMRPVFFITGLFIFITFLLTLFFVKENFVREDKKVCSMREVWAQIPEKNLTIILSVTFFTIALALFSIEPIVTIYVKQLSGDLKYMALTAGLTFSISGLANIISAPVLGRLSDKIGAHKVLLFALITSGIFFLPQAFVQTTGQLIFLRFLVGLTVGGLAPAVNTLIKKITPSAQTGRIFGFTMSAQYLGGASGAVLGGQISAAFGMPSVFFVTSGLLLLNAAWFYLYVYKRWKKNGDLQRSAAVESIHQTQPDDLQKCV